MISASSLDLSVQTDTHTLDNLFTEHTSSEKSFTEEQKKVFITVLRARSKEIRDVLKENSVNVGTHLKDFDWKLNVTLSSDKFSKSQEPLLIIQLRLEDENMRERNVMLELGKDELDNLLGSFSKIQQVLSKAHFSCYSSFKT